MPLFKPNKHQPKRPPFHKEAQYSLLSNLCNLDGLITVLHTKLFYLSILCQDVVLMFAEHLGCFYYTFQMSAEASVIVTLRNFLGCISQSKCFCFELRLKQITSFVWFFGSHATVLCTHFTKLTWLKAKQTKYLLVIFQLCCDRLFQCHSNRRQKKSKTG